MFGGWEKRDDVLVIIRLRCFALFAVEQPIYIGRSISGRCNIYVCSNSVSKLLLQSMLILYRNVSKVLIKMSMI
jgi:hypothetical protein